LLVLVLEPCVAVLVQAQVRCAAALVQALERCAAAPVLDPELCAAALVRALERCAGALWLGPVEWRAPDPLQCAEDPAEWLALAPAQCLLPLPSRPRAGRNWRSRARSALCAASPSSAACLQ